MSRRGGGRYITKVKDVTGNLGRKVNLIGVVVEFSIPRKGNGTDYCTVLKIMDRSQQSPELCVNVFTENIHQLPHIRSRKDIILLCDINIRNDSQNPVWAVFSKSYSSFALFSGEDINDFIPYQASPRFCLLDSDKEFMRSLRTWCISFPYDGETSYREAEFATLMDLITWPQEVFFERYPAINVLNAQMKKLLGMPESGDTPRDPPWTEFCIKLHAGAAGSRHLHICDTRLL
ncbi:hypothetical protein RJ639_012547 [Escallonia herrerae]|uniref:Telomeric single stranded DNA binding POT1/Cdc13 domain-containing protein n=1 Tax=Escallonia herrerae TaxID=1293975 RepID=A0AA88VNB7_9ASTE|nr:hypothetical protein RJ639_012547 [Escallonia herrerae]